MWRSDLGAHIDGFIATAAHTVVAQEDPEAPVKGRAANLLNAASTALEAAIRLIRPGKRISEVMLVRTFARFAGLAAAPLRGVRARAPAKLERL